MKENELEKKLNDIASGRKWIDKIIHYNHKKTDEQEKHYITERQRSLLQAIFDLFDSLRWQISLNSYKELNIKESPPVKEKLTFGGSCGDQVKVRPCGKEYGDKTYFGILLGEIPLSISAGVDKEGNLNISRSMYNPAIFVPDLKKIIYGCGSWWGKIESEEELNKLITDETIENVWYVKILSSKAFK